MIVLATVTAVKKGLISQYFLKEQFDTFDNRCDALRAAFCDSCDVCVQSCLVTTVTTVITVTTVTIFTIVTFVTTITTITTVTTVPTVTIVSKKVQRCVLITFSYSKDHLFTKVDGRTDQRTDQRTDGQLDFKSCSGQLKIHSHKNIIFFVIFVHIVTLLGN